jgi:hypothetical protein
MYKILGLISNTTEIKNKEMQQNSLWAPQKLQPFDIAYTEQYPVFPGLFPYHSLWWSGLSGRMSA